MVPRAFGLRFLSTQQNMTMPGKGILAADESTGTIGKRFAYNRRVRP